MIVIACFLTAFLDIIGIWVLFDRFKIIKGWSIEELTINYGIIHMGVSLANIFSKGFAYFSQMIKKGNFDRILLRPLNPLLQIATQNFNILPIGHFLQGLVVLIWGICKLNLKLFSLNIFIIFISIIGTASLFFGLFIIQATITFWTIETLEMMNIITLGGLKVAQYPMDIYKKLFRFFCTFIIPLTCIGYYPFSIMLRHENYILWYALLFPLAGILFLYLTTLFWKCGIKHYHSTGN